MHAFDYKRPGTLGEAELAIMAAPGAKLLAGGQTLLPAMKLRLASHKAIVDLSGVAALRSITRKDGALNIGAMTTHAAVAESAEVKAAIPGLAHVAEGIGDPHVRHRGTIGGSLANNDPAADYPAAILALAATIHTNKRAIKADDFFTGLFSTALADGEIITAVSIPMPERFTYAKMAHPASRFALTAVAVAKTGGGVRVAVTGAGANGVFRWQAAEAALTKDFSAKALAAAALDESTLLSDIHGAADYRASLVRAMTKRALG